jgi:reactive intermediate/imine deaminase
MSESKTVSHVVTENAPKPAGHYSQATIAGGYIFISGQLPIRPDGTVLADHGFEAQATQAITNLLAILTAAGSTPQQLARVTAYIVGVRHWPEFNAIYARLLPNALPARSVVPVPELHHGVLIEIEGIAVR